MLNITEVPPVADQQAVFEFSIGYVDYTLIIEAIGSTWPITLCRQDVRRGTFTMKPYKSIQEIESKIKRLNGLSKLLES